MKRSVATRHLQALKRRENKIKLIAEVALPPGSVLVFDIYSHGGWRERVFHRVKRFHISSLPHQSSYHCITA
jgi:hypothetical protein